MVLESTMICVDSSEYMRNGDFVPTRFQAQQDAVSMVCHSKTRSNPENNVGLLTMSTSPQVLTTLTTDVGRILSKLHAVTPAGEVNLLTGIRVAHLALKHRQGKNHKMRIVVFIGSPISTDEKELIKLAKRLKKEKVNVDIVNFGEEATNTEVLTAFIKTLEGTGSHLVTVPPGPLLSEALISSPVIQGEDGSGSVGIDPYGVDPNEDPELALALRVSMEEQRQRQEEDARKRQAESSSETPAGTSSGEGTTTSANTEEALLEKALAMSLEPHDSETGEKSAQKNDHLSMPDLSNMSEEDQIAYALQMSLQQAHESAAKAKLPESPVPMETDDDQKKDDEESDPKEKK